MSALTPFQIMTLIVNGMAFLCSIGITYTVRLNLSKWSQVSYMRRMMFITGLLSIGSQITNFASKYNMFFHYMAMGDSLYKRKYGGLTFISGFFFFTQYLFLTMCSIERYRHLQSSVKSKRSWKVTCLIVISWTVIPAGFIVSPMTREVLPQVGQLIVTASACLWIIFCDTMLDLKMINMTIKNVGNNREGTSRKSTSLVGRAGHLFRKSVSKSTSEIERPDGFQPGSYSQGLASPSQNNNPTSQTSQQDLPNHVSKAERLSKLKTRLYLYYFALIVVDCCLLLVYLLGSVVPRLTIYKVEFEQLASSIAVLHILVSFSLLDMFKSGVIQDKGRKSSTSKPASFKVLKWARKSSSKQPQHHSVTELSSIQAPSIQINGIPAETPSEVQPNESRMFSDSDEDVRAKGKVGRFQLRK